MPSASLKNNKIFKMNQKTFTITPDTKEIDLTADVYYVKDHIPDVEDLSGNFDTDFSLQNSNSIKYYFEKHGVDYKKKNFVFDHYLYFEDFKNNGYFDLQLFMEDINDFLQYEKENSIRNFSADKFIDKNKYVLLNCLMNKARAHREIVSCWLLNNVKPKNLVYTQSWECKGTSSAKKFVDFLDNKNSIKEYKELPRRWVKFQSTSDYNNPEIFYQYFNPKIFSKTLFSLILEPDFLVNACSISEKYLYAIKGLTIPIVSGYKIYEKLQVLGFNVFDDIINTEYQYETHPVKRIWKMLESNKDIMSGNIERFRNTSVKQRIVDNYNHISNTDKLLSNFSFLNNHID